jgi:hypothetical protein
MENARREGRGRGGSEGALGNLSCSAMESRPCSGLSSETSATFSTEVGEVMNESRGIEALDGGI